VTNPEDEKTTDVDDAVDESDAVDEAAAPEVLDDAAVAEEAPRRSRVDWGRVAAYGLLPALALILALAAGFLKYVDNSVRESATARAESMQAASASTIALLSYTPDKVEQQLNDARSLLTGDFLDSYTSLINQVVIPGAKQQQISAIATVPKVGSISADPNEAVALVFVNQAVTVGADAPTSTTSSVRVTLEKTGDKWLISEFAPV
jgi:Mce-associated membrane protein